jgi:hypothetical protein
MTSPVPLIGGSGALAWVAGLAAAAGDAAGLATGDAAATGLEAGDAAATGLAAGDAAAGLAAGLAASVGFASVLAAGCWPLGEKPPHAALSCERTRITEMTAHRRPIPVTPPLSLGGTERL